MMKILSSAAILAAALAPSAISAQNERSSPIPRYHVLQLSVGSADVLAEEFQTKTEAIRSCGEARKLAKALGADTKRNRFLRASLLTDDLRVELSGLQTGQATRVFTDSGSTLRVLVLCNRA